MPPPPSRQGFTLIELLIVIAVIGILAVVLLLILNPVELVKQSRDSNRLSNQQSLTSAVDIASANNISLGTPKVVYVSVPDPTLSGNATSNCAALGLPTLPAAWSYQCVSAQNLQNVDGTGWLPINLKSLPSGAPFGSLPVDTINTTSSYQFLGYATDGTKYEATTHIESQKYTPIQWTDAGEFSDLKEAGTNRKLIPVDLGGGDVYVASCSFGAVNHQWVEDFTANGAYLSQMGSGKLDECYGLTTDVNNGNIYVVDWSNQLGFVFDPSGKFLFKFGQAQTMTDPDNIAFSPNGNFYVSDRSQNRVYIFKEDGTFVSQFGSAGSSTGQFSSAEGVAFDATGNVYVVDRGNSRVEKFDANGNYLSQWGSSGTLAGYFSAPHGIAFDPTGNIYVVDTGNNRVEKFDANGTYVSQFGSLGSSTGTFSTPWNIAIDLVGNIYVTDNGNFRVEKFDSTGTYLSQWGSHGSATGQFGNPVPIGIQQ